MNDRAAEIQEIAVQALRLSLERQLAERTSISPHMFGISEDDVYIDIRAECAEHGPTRVVARAEHAFCAECLRAVRDGRSDEVISFDDDGAFCLPGLTLYPEAPINFISIRATVVSEGASS